MLVLVEMWWILEFINFVIDTVGKQLLTPNCLNFMWRQLVPKQRTREHLDCIPPVAHCVCKDAQRDLLHIFFNSESINVQFEEL